MTSIITSYFTSAMCAAIRKREIDFLAAWKKYVSFHRDIVTFDPKNSYQLMENFKVIFNELTCDNPKSPVDFQRYLINMSAPSVPCESKHHIQWIGNWDHFALPVDDSDQ